MIKLGAYQQLTIQSKTDEGYFLADTDGDDVLMPNRFITDEMNIGDTIKVFVYSDTDDIDIASTEEPFFTVNQFAYLEVMDVNRIGAFCHWGLEKELFIPFSNQGDRLQRGQFVIVYMYVDEMTDRLVGTTKIKKYLKPHADENIKKGDRVDLIVLGKTDLGYKVIINHTYAGLVFHDEVFDKITLGQDLTGYIKPIRPDRKIDVSLQPIGHRSIEPNAQKILEHLDSNNGFVPLNDKSDPEKIQETFGISKKLFKKSIGGLYKQRLISIDADGIRKV